MKHVFIVHSHVTFLSSIGVVNHLMIEPKNVVLLCGRNYNNDILSNKYLKIDANSLYYSIKDAYEGDTYKIKKKAIQRLDNFVNENINEEYRLYVPNFCLPFFCLLYTHRLCREAAYIQEGAVVLNNVYRVNYSYLKVFRDIIINCIQRKPLRTWFPCTFYRDKYLYKQKELHSYALNNNIFNYLPSINHIIEWPQVQIDYVIKEKSVIFIADGVVKNKMVESDIYLKMMDRLIGTYGSSINYIKFHPNESKEERNEIIGLFRKNNIFVNIIPDDIPLELLFVSYRKLNVVGFCSSLCYFAKDLGHNLICREDWILEASACYRNHIQNAGILTFDNYYLKYDE